MKLPLTFNKETDIPALKWLVTAAVVYVFFSQWGWSLAERAEFNESLTRVLAWELEKVLGLLGYEVSRNQSFLSVKGLPVMINIIPRCLSFLGGGFTIYLAVVLTLPSCSLRARVFWFIAGSLMLSAANLLRITVVIILAYMDPSSFDPVHRFSMSFSTLVGGIISLLAVRSLSLNPRGIKVFRRSKSQNVPEAGGIAQGK